MMERDPNAAFWINAVGGLARATRDEWAEHIERLGPAFVAGSVLTPPVAGATHGILVTVFTGLGRHASQDGAYVTVQIGGLGGGNRQWRWGSHGSARRGHDAIVAAYAAGGDMPH